MKTLVLGVGNPILSDDGVGIHVARRLKARKLFDVDVDEIPASGLELLDVVRGYDRLIIVDAIQTEGGVPGEIHELVEEDFEKSIHGSSPHGINIATALALGRRLVPEEMPRVIFFIAIEAQDLENVSENLTPEVERAVDKAVGIIEDKINLRSS